MHRPSASDDLRSPERRRWLKQAGQLAIAGGLLAGGGWAVLKRKQNLWQVRRERTLMQTSVAVTCLADDVQAAGVAIEAAFARMAATAAQLTRFDPASPLARLNRDGQLAQVPAQLDAVLRQALSLSRLTDGAFDPTVLPVLRYFETLRGTGTSASSIHATSAAWPWCCNCATRRCRRPAITACSSPPTGGCSTSSTRAPAGRRKAIRA